MIGGYGSHAPALMAVAKFIEIHSVIEFGGGVSSTFMFLDTSIYPHLESLVTFEHSRKYAKNLLINDDRHTLIVQSPNRFAETAQTMRADMVFLDSGPSTTMRWKLMGEIKHLAPVIAAHDCKEGTAKNLGTFRYSKTFNSNIQTTFFSNDVDLSELEL